MDTLRNRPIKELIAAYPAVGAVMKRFGIGCVTCSAGTCMTGDVVGIHQLDARTAALLFKTLADIVAAGPSQTSDPDALEIPVPTPAEKRSALSPPLRILVEEHDTIKRVLEMIPGLLSAIDPLTEEGRARAGETIFFIRNYADRYHHAKEEDILFQLFDPSLDMIGVMLADHAEGREHVRLAEEALAAGNGTAAARHFTAYRELLTDHIRREDEILYPWIDSRLGTAEVGRLYAGFAEADRAADPVGVKRCLRFADYHY